MGEMEGGGADLERALLELGPLLGVSVKQEMPDDASARQSMVEGGGGGVGEDKAGPATPERAPPADSLESPTAARANPWTTIKCVFCDQPLLGSEGSPKLMECLHSACEGCIKAKIEEKHSGRDFLGAERLTIACAVCKIPCQPANMIDQQFVVEKLATDNCGNGGGAVGEQHCNSCSEDNVATSWCIECAEFICDVCVQAHQRLKITKDHTIKSKEEAAQEIQALTNATSGAHDMYCKEHTQERLSLFCETCDRLTCRDCQLLHHRDHKYQFSTEMAAQARSSIASLLSEVSYKRVLLGSAMKVIKDRQTLIADKKKALVHEITQTVVKLTNTINTRGKQLVLRLNEVCDGKQKTLNEKKQALEQLSAITDHCIEFVNAALGQGSDTAVLYSKRQVTQHLQRIKSRRADIPNPEIPVRINLALEKVPDLIKVLSSIGGIVVDGKVDSSPNAPPPAASPHSQGPYHPPPATPPAAHQPPAAPPPGPSASAVVALQHVAMQQNYVNSRSGGASPSAAPPPYSSAVMSQIHHQMQASRHAQQNPGGPVLGALGVRAAPALRHPHVTSTTHPHHMQGMNDLNLRGLLNQSGQYVSQQQQRQFVRQNHALQAAAYQQVMGAYASGAFAAAAAASAAQPRSRSGGAGPRTPSPAPPHAAQYAPAAHLAAHAQQQAAAKWHIPQHGATNGLYEGATSPFLTGGGGAGAPNNDFKITLNRQPGAGRPTPSTPSAVTSTNPKTPSPSLNGGASSEATVSIDKLCQESVQDLMRTIAKLDSNGVQVLPEAHAAAAAAGKTTPSPHVHSSTDDPLNKSSVAAGATEAGGAGDPNEDWCAVCMDGGELMCCDKCPKVFHQYCHIPTIDKLPEETETWQCLLCVNFSELPPESAAGERRGGGLTPRQQKIIERVTLELYCQYESSMAFREPVPLDNIDYHSKISCPMALDTIRMKLQPTCGQRYLHVSEMVGDVRLMFRNAYTYNPVDSQIYKDAKRLEQFFDLQLEKWLPEYAYYDPGVDDTAGAKRLKHNGLE